nr:MAG TPA: hypothetical protein [Caudoviricetes sp.]
MFVSFYLSNSSRIILSVDVRLVCKFLIYSFPFV